jgi:hypothetical protein
VAICCEHGNETSGFIKGGEFLDQLSECKLLKRDSAPWSCRERNAHFSDVLGFQSLALQGCR